MSGQMAAALGGVGVLIAIALLLFGHTLNLVLGVMGGVVHGLRLNFIEFFNWSALDEGYPFQAFSKRVTDEWKTGR
jgi:V/A-type H+-transporting ATPase subunit I